METSNVPKTPQFTPPPTIVNGFAVTANLQSIILTTGSQVPMIVDGQFQGVAVQWTGAIAMSAPTARLIADALNKSLEEYERRYGKIPTDPNAVPKFTVSQPA